jgi:hypothetical protein
MDALGNGWCRRVEPGDLGGECGETGKRRPPRCPTRKQERAHKVSQGDEERLETGEESCDTATGVSQSEEMEPERGDDPQSFVGRKVNDGQEVGWMMNPAGPWQP